MRQTLRGRELWSGFHEFLGVVIYDPLNQQGLSADKVRLYSFKNGRCLSGIFLKEEVRPLLRSEKRNAELADAIIRYVDIVGLVMGLSCHSCKKPFSTSGLSACLKCNRLRCPCGTNLCVCPGACEREIEERVDSPKKKKTRTLPVEQTRPWSTVFDGFDDEEDNDIPPLYDEEEDLWERGCRRRSNPIEPDVI